MSIISLLTKFWLTEKEAKIYLDLLENGNSRITAIAARLGLHRVEIYRLLPGLVEKWIISKAVEGKTATYLAASPEKLEKLLDDIREWLASVLPSLQEKYQKKRSKDIIQVYNGINAIEKLYNDIGNELPQWWVYYRYTSRSDDNRKWWKTFEKYRKLRKEKQLRRYIIISESGSKHKSKDPNRSVAVVPARFDAFDDNFQKIIYNDKVAIVDMLGNRAYVIENPDLARFETKLFKFMYKFLKEFEVEK